jgi:hypothetical protein
MSIRGCERQKFILFYHTIVQNGTVSNNGKNLDIHVLRLLGTIPNHTVPYCFTSVDHVLKM